MKIYRFVFLFSALAFMSCKNEGITPVEIEQEIKDSLFSNRYHGVLPCGDCPGIETTLVLHADSTLTKTFLYQSKQQQPTTINGTWKLKDSVFETNFDGNKEFYKIKNGTLIARVGSDHKEVKGKLAQDYLLHLQEAPTLDQFLGSFIQGDTLSESYHKVAIREIKKNDLEFVLTSVSPNDTCTLKLRGVENLTNHSLKFPIKTGIKNEEGNISVYLSEAYLHLLKDNSTTGDSLLHLCDSLPVNLNGGYIKISSPKIQE